MLTLNQLTVHYGPNQILAPTSFTIPPGQILALVGPNGAGKTTLLKAISGTIPYNGHISINHTDLQQLTPQQRARQLAVVPQARQLPADYTVRQTVLLGRSPYLGWLGQASPTDQKRVTWALQQTSLTSLANRPLQKLSGGEQQRVLLARALAQQTPVLLLDEPTTHLDLHHQTHLLTLIRQLATNQQLAILIVLHDLSLAAHYADRIALLKQGHLHHIGTPHQTLTPTKLTAIFDTPIQVIPHPQTGTPLILPQYPHTTPNTTTIC
ncbi:MAG TPA: heme ABC transporter ATP-binding protein [Anaerolineae bacterium]|nr:heme ABC transporter ATP-binding protein [Anaerolineae bacterium]